MKQFKYRIFVCALYAALAFFVISWLYAVAHFTVFPMYENYKECGSVFLCNTEDAQ